ncbi:MAG: ribonuclease P protein subunit [Candidatus Odinarchaeota archaeon]
MIDPKYLIYHDLIGFTAYVKSKSKLRDKAFLDIGIVIDDTKNILFTKKNNKIKKYIKKDHIFRFKVPNYNNEEEEYYLEVQGNKIVGSPINRLRSLKKKRWLKT